MKLFFRYKQNFFCIYLHTYEIYLYICSIKYKHNTKYEQQNETHGGAQSDTCKHQYAQ